MSHMEQSGTHHHNKNLRSEGGNTQLSNEQGA